jgi:hypothetical protein
MSRKKKILLIAFAFVTVLIHYSSKNDYLPARYNGEALANAYCSVCHLKPEPTSLDKITWQNYVLPRMGKFMGIVTTLIGDELYFTAEEKKELLASRKIIFEEVLLDNNQWQAIVDYYIKAAPDSLFQPICKGVLDSTTFKLVYPDYFINPPATTLVYPIRNGLISADAHTKKLYLWDNNFLPKSELNLNNEGCVAINETPDNYLLTIMGSFSPSDKPLGTIVQVSKKAGEITTLIPYLNRPINSSYADLNQDGLQDILVSEYGKWLGQLSLHLLNKDDRYSKQVISNHPGCLKTEIIDINKDGLLDIIALFGQGDEKLTSFINQGHGKFSENLILRFPPNYGSSGFRLVDINSDNHVDIIYFNGDLADFPIAYKPYQGIRILTNNGKNQFNELTFLPFSGVYDAIPLDVDGDGDLDMAAISFQTNTKCDSQGGFVWFENINRQYTKRVIPNIDQGRWIRMDTFDYNNDGRTDIVLGNLVMELHQDPTNRAQKWLDNGLPFVVLEHR